MTAARHKAAVERSKRRRLVRVAAPALAATVITGSVVGVAIGAGGGDAAPDNARVAAGQLSRPIVATKAAERLEDREQRISRSARRVTIEDKPVPNGHRFSTADLNIRQTPGENAGVVTTVDLATKLAVTGEVKGDFAEVVWKKRAYWVSADYLAKKKPDEDEVAAGGVNAAPCSAVAPIESGITSNAVRVARAVCNAFPMITSYGGYRGDGEHSDGRAVDIMVSGDLGWQVANYLRANSSTFGLYDVIYSQRIWTAQRGAEGWRYMSDRGSTTANHYDHVHVKVF